MRAWARTRTRYRAAGRGQGWRSRAPARELECHVARRRGEGVRRARRVSSGESMRESPPEDSGAAQTAGREALRTKVSATVPSPRTASPAGRARRAAPPRRHKIGRARRRHLRGSNFASIALAREREPSPGPIPTPRAPLGDRLVGPQLSLPRRSFAAPSPRSAILAMVAHPHDDRHVEAFLAECVHESLNNYMISNAVFLGERLSPRVPTRAPPPRPAAHRSSRQPLLPRPRAPHSPPTPL